MKDLPRSQFIFTVCQVGAEPALKSEVLRLHPELRFAFSRPGFVTFKVQEPSLLGPDFALGSIFARAYGLCFGKVPLTPASSLDPVLELAHLLKRESPLHLHAWERDQYFPGDEPLGFVRGQWAQQAKQTLMTLSGAQGLFETRKSRPAAGEPVFDWIATSADEAWYGYHLHSDAEYAPVPGGRFEITADPEAPSRAFTKLEEAIAWAKIPLRRGDVALEIGSAPGGASHALLRRGLQVIGIDPGEMDPRILHSLDFHPISKMASQVRRGEIPKSPQWLLLDINAEPRVALIEVERLIAGLGSSLPVAETLLGCVLTLKLNRWAIAEELPTLLDRIKSWGLVRIRATQLSSNRQEVVVVGFTRQGMLRMTTA